MLVESLVGDLQVAGTRLDEAASVGKVAPLEELHAARLKLATHITAALLRLQPSPLHERLAPRLYRIRNGLNSLSVITAENLTPTALDPLTADLQHDLVKVSAELREVCDVLQGKRPRRRQR